MDVVPLRPDLRDEALRLQSHLWGSDAAANAAYLAWKHDGNPYLPAPQVLLALDAGRVVGMLGMFGTLWIAGDSRVVIPAIGDYVTHPDVRGRGVAGVLLEGALAHLAARGIDWVATLYPTGPASRRFLKLGWRSVGTDHAYGREPGIPGYKQRVLGFIRRKAGLAPRGPYDRLDARGGRGDVIVEREPRPALMARLDVPDDRLRHVRDAAFFAWRYRNPLSSYRFLFWKDEGYLVLSAPRGAAFARAHVVEWVGARPDVRADLMRAAVELGDFEMFGVWEESIRDGEAALLESLGMPRLPKREAPTLLIRPVRGDDWTLAGRDATAQRHWSLQAIDSEAF